MNSMNSMNSMNPGMYPMFPFMPQMLNYQLYMEQLIKTNPFAALQMQKMMSLANQNPQNMPNIQNSGYIPFSKLPISRPNIDKK